MKSIDDSSSDRLFISAFLLYCKTIPEVLNRSLLTYFEIILQRISDIIGYSKLPGYYLSGEEKYSGEPFAVFYAGNSDSLHFLTCRLFNSHYTIKKIGTFSIFQLKKIVRMLPSSTDIALIKTDRFFLKILQKLQFVAIPEWINMVLDSSKPLKEITNSFSSGARKDIKKVSEYSYSYELTNDEKKMEFFYCRMFLPYMLERYGEEMPEYYQKYIHMLIKRNSIKLLLVKDDGTYISGGLVDIKGKQEFLPSMGVLDGHIKYVKKYASSALFYFHILTAKDRGICAINYGNTRSFLNDGNYQFKRKWGMKVISSKFRWGLFGLKILRNSTSVSSFCVHNPYIFLEDNYLKGCIYSSDNQPTTLVDLQHICRTYYTPGVTELLILSPQGFTQKAKENELFEGTSKYNFVKSFTGVKLLNQEIEACVIRPQESMFNSFVIG